ncbi:MAG: nuclear transport factor 2 family protein [Silvibacterium sp.]|jgi:ketosteroid isomerase-like protein
MTKMISILATSIFTAAFAWSAHGQNTAAIPAGIERLHKDDITATIARDVDALTALLDDDAVLLQPGTPPIIGKAAFHDFMKQALAKSPSVKVVKYVPDIRDIQVTGNVAYEWGYFDAAQKSSDQQAPENLRAKLLRVMKRQPDGSWKFTRVMWLPD